MRSVITKSCRMCSSTKNLYPTLGRSLNFLGVGGYKKANILEANYESKLEFSGGRGVQNKSPSLGGVWIVFGTAQEELDDSNFISKKRITAFALWDMFWQISVIITL